MSKKFNYVVRHVSVLFYKAAFELQIYEGQHGTSLYVMLHYCMPESGSS